jgi:uncharacterized protein YodC (DUF2158 family)
MEFNAGDTVQLKSGGPIMTVAGKNQMGQIITQWFVDSDLKRGTFNAESLDKADTTPRF